MTSDELLRDCEDRLVPLANGSKAQAVGRMWRYALERSLDEHVEPDAMIDLFFQLLRERDNRHAEGRE